MPSLSQIKTNLGLVRRDFIEGGGVGKDYYNREKALTIRSASVAEVR